VTIEPARPAATGQDGRHLDTCPLCEAMCGLEIEVADGRIAAIRGNADDVWSRGHLCPKGVSLGAIHDDPDRVRTPMIKVDGQWQEVSWDAAFRRCTELLAPVSGPCSMIRAVKSFNAAKSSWWTIVGSLGGLRHFQESLDDPPFQILAGMCLLSDRKLASVRHIPRI